MSNGRKRLREKHRSCCSRLPSAVREQSPVRRIMSMLQRVHKLSSLAAAASPLILYGVSQCVAQRVGSASVRLL